MKVAVTGHTSGLGQALLTHYTRSGHQVQGFSRSNGFDLRDWSKLQKFLDSTQDFDFIVSNAKPDFSQTILLYEWAKRPKRAHTMISIGSMIIETILDKDCDIGINLYKTQKISLQNAHQQLTAKYPDLCSILIHPAHLYDKDSGNDAVISWINRMEIAISSQSQKELFVH